MVARRLIDDLDTTAPPKNREEEAVKGQSASGGTFRHWR